MERQSTSNRESASTVNRVTEHFREGYDSATECISEHPATSMLITFGVGFGLGLLLGHMMGEPPREERSGLASFGRNVLDAMSRYVPDSVAKRMGVGS